MPVASNKLVFLFNSLNQIIVMIAEHNSTAADLWY